MAETIVMQEPEGRTATDAMRELAASIVHARQLADELLSMNPTASELEGSALDMRDWPLFKEDVLGWRYMLKYAIEVFESNTVLLDDAPFRARMQRALRN